MTPVHRQLNKQDLTAYVRAHENEHVQHYVEAIYDENAELKSRLAAVMKAGYTDDGRAALRNVAIGALVLAIAATTFVLGKFSN